MAPPMPEAGQHYLCKDCRKQFPEYYHAQACLGEVQRNCLTMYLIGLGFRAIERVTGVHRTIVFWVKQAASDLNDAPEVEKNTPVAQIGKTVEMLKMVVRLLQNNLLSASNCICYSMIIAFFKVLPVGKPS
jgi:hypothetical protein